MNAAKRLIKASKPEDDRIVEQLLINYLSEILPSQEKFERTYGRSQWPAFLRRLVMSTDVLRSFMSGNPKGDQAWIKPAINRAASSQDLKKVIQKLEKQAHS